jgi:hypothetical protein
MHFLYSPSVGFLDGDFVGTAMICFLLRITPRNRQRIHRDCLPGVGLLVGLAVGFFDGDLVGTAGDVYNVIR